MRSLSPLKVRRPRRARALRRSTRGVTDVPLELLIIVIILAIVIPIIVASLITYSNDQETLAVQEQVANMRDVAVQAYDDGINTTLLVSISLPGNGVITAGGSIYLRGGFLNYQAAYIKWGTHNVYSFSTLVDNGVQNVLLTNITCNTPNPGLNFRPFVLPPGNSQIALTKISPGGFFCGMPDPTNTTGFVEVQQIP
ncbi:MAG: hypothetical protein KGJ23_01250 [Euryarchaeota archaeon]|nr:hypothetical protein [Euryarchaeota archaeon]MDE1835224.1 hypothetical protein [Euryarchaeota archaeon]MDE1880081.1 hypothetical protein [Euryarchaeota archaeon]MDE2043520.1 hypothetical protein [Thermoplasmata archaeon]